MTPSRLPAGSAFVATLVCAVVAATVARADDGSGGRYYDCDGHGSDCGYDCSSSDPDDVGIKCSPARAGDSPGNRYCGTCKQEDPGHCGPFEDVDFEDECAGIAAQAECEATECVWVAESDTCQHPCIGLDEEACAEAESTFDCDWIREPGTCEDVEVCGDADTCACARVPITPRPSLAVAGAALVTALLLGVRQRRR